ncbi:ribbon-helix-helix domain-containing protein [Devosia rhizoryzae]|uniref:Type II toxin-antitoxin system ParD family antitoxin n=1 Tax=Devosia rhizoryzae TaxID=2774137 RepID=A0ABX7C7R5_9HYPH|nr:ribbon-helix-helix domain-containing protein [Devosia rhizoryzae]QQR40308.1 type II toxin-antitoxin system ParD family antitoxin [Devosia rhizoryzae]
MNEKLSITLPSELVAVLQEQVDSGRYDTISDVVRNALEQQDWAHVDFTESEIEYMREKTRKSLADSRPTISVEEMRARLDAHLDKLYGR